MKRSILFLFFLTLSVAALAQDTAHSHQPKPHVIKGSETPDQIPDLIAYRLFFIAVTATDDSPAEIAKEEAHITNIGLDFLDTVNVRVVLRDFRKQYDAMVTEYNSQVHEAADYSFLQVRVDKLVTDTLNKLDSAASHSGSSRLHDHVKSEKRGMELVGQ